MPGIQQFQQGAQVLQQVDVSDIFISLAMGIADAQSKLDDNSIAQLTKLAQTKVGDKSLLELGFMPTFYAFQYADISASIHLRMALKESITLGAQATFDLAKSKGFSDKEARFASSDNYKSLMQEYKSSRSFSFKASKKSSVRIFEREYGYQIQNDFRKALRELREDISRHEKIDLVIQEILAQDLTIKSATGLYVWQDRGLLRVQKRLDFEPGIRIGILRLKELNNNDQFDLDGSITTDNNSFSNNSTFKDLVQAARSANTNGKVYGISSEGKFYSDLNNNEVPTEIYFRFNDFEILYDENLKYTNDKNDLVINIGSNSHINKNHTHHPLFHQCLRLIHEKDPEVIFTITGYTDPVGGKSKTNELLARKRAESLRSHIFNDPSRDNIVIKTQTSDSGSNSDLRLRKAEIELNHHYIIFIGGNITENATPGPTEHASNKFIWLYDIPDQPDKFSVDIQYGGEEIEIMSEDNIEDVINKIMDKGLMHSQDSELKVHYLLHEEAVVKMTLFSEKEEISEMENTVTEEQEKAGAESAAIVSEEKSKISNALSHLSEKSGMQTFGLGVSVDFRFARQFEMEVSGNASMSARMVALPPPEGFKLYIQSLYQ